MAAPSMKKHGSKTKTRKSKVILEFDEHARAEYLKGFHKRKLQRKQVARDKKEKVLQDERKAIRQKIKDLKTSTTFMSKSYTPIPEIEQLAKPEVFDMPDHTVTITNIGEVDFVGKTGLRLGQNTGNIPSSTAENEETDEKETSQAQPQADTKTKNKSLLRQLANCSNQLALEKSRKANRKRDAERKHKDKKVKKKKNKLKKGKKK